MSWTGGISMESYGAVEKEIFTTQCPLRKQEVVLDHLVFNYTKAETNKQNALTRWSFEEESQAGEIASLCWEHTTVSLAIRVVCFRSTEVGSRTSCTLAQARLPFWPWSLSNDYFFLKSVQVPGVWAGQMFFGALEQCGKSQEGGCQCHQHTL